MYMYNIHSYICTCTVYISVHMHVNIYMHVHVYLHIMLSSCLVLLHSRFSSPPPMLRRSPSPPPHHRQWRERERERERRWDTPPHRRSRSPPMHPPHRHSRDRSRSPPPPRWHRVTTPPENQDRRRRGIPVPRDKHMTGMVLCLSLSTGNFIILSLPLSPLSPLSPLPPLPPSYLSAFALSHCYIVCSTTLWVGHLSKLATKDTVKEAFEDFGQVKSVEVCQHMYVYIVFAGFPVSYSSIVLFHQMAASCSSFLVFC